MKIFNKYTLNNKGYTALLILPLIAILAVAGIGVHLMSSSGASGNCKDYTYKVGSAGTCVKNIQTILNLECTHANNLSDSYPIYPSCKKITVDGQFGAETKAQAVVFQKYFKLSQDGVVGPNTWKQLCSWGLQWKRIGSTDSLAVAGYNAAKASGCQ